VGGYHPCIALGLTRYPPIVRPSYSSTPPPCILAPPVRVNLSMFNCNTIARPLRNIRPATDPSFVRHTPYNIFDDNMVVSRCLGIIPPSGIPPLGRFFCWPPIFVASQSYLPIGARRHLFKDGGPPRPRERQRTLVHTSHSHNTRPPVPSFFCFVGVPVRARGFCHSPRRFLVVFL